MKPSKPTIKIAVAVSIIGLERMVNMYSLFYPPKCKPCEDKTIKPSFHDRN